MVVGNGSPSGDDVGSFVGIPSLGDVPRDPAAAAVASGASGAGRRLERSRLLASARRIADALAGQLDPGTPGSWTDPAREDAATRKPGRGSGQGVGRDGPDIAAPAVDIPAMGSAGAADVAGRADPVASVRPGAAAR